MHAPTSSTSLSHHSDAGKRQLKMIRGIVYLLYWNKCSFYLHNCELYVMMYFPYQIQVKHGCSFCAHCICDYFLRVIDTISRTMMVALTQYIGLHISHSHHPTRLLPHTTLLHFSMIMNAPYMCDWPKLLNITLQHTAMGTTMMTIILPLWYLSPHYTELNKMSVVYK